MRSAARGASGGTAARILSRRIASLLPRLNRSGERSLIRSAGGAQRRASLDSCSESRPRDSGAPAARHPNPPAHPGH
ncbi:MAG TPA: hypothetical protein VK009_08665 [Chloroflexota bacterium]|nr:hypothetical protein [Chloroflexota bacterium]